MEEVPNYCELLKIAGLRSTKQRVLLSEIIFSRGNWHFTAEMVQKKIKERGCYMSLATIYNNISRLVETGLLKKLTFDSSRSYFDTNIEEHSHFYDSEGDTVIDFKISNPELLDIIDIPIGMIIDRVDIIVRLKKSDGS